MCKFLDGPAAGVALMLRRTPLYLRVVRDTTFSGAVCKKGRREWDALDQIDDTPAATEAVSAYRRVKREGAVFLDWTEKGRRQGGCFQLAVYRFVDPQPPETTLRDLPAWQSWCLLQADKEGRLGAAFVLWARRSGAWKPVRAALTEAALTAVMVKMPSGDYATLPAGVDPNTKARR
jgi:hypothetical protein